MALMQKFEGNQLDHPPGERWISMSNGLARAAHGLSLNEKRLVMASVAKLDSRNPHTALGPPMVRLSAAEYAETFNMDLSTAYTALQDAAKALYERTITFHEPPGSVKRKNSKPAVTRMRWVGQATYHEGEAWVELHFWHKVVPHLLGLSKRFTTYQLEQGRGLRCSYSWKLMELFMSFAKPDGGGWMEIDLDKFCVSMEATEKQRANFAQIRLRIIDPAVAELTGKDNWMIEWRPIKTGKKVTGLRFAFQRNPQQRLAL